MTRILVANDIDENLFLRRDTRAWSQRVFWLAEPGDVVVLPDTPDRTFIDHVGRVRRTDLDTVRISIAPPGRYGAKMIDMRSLCEPGYVGDIRAMLSPDTRTEIVLLFPSIDTRRFAKALGEAALEGQEFFRQGGANLCNSKAAFRALATGVVPIADGEVCFTRTEAENAMRDLLTSRGRVLVKRAQAGGGVGNELLSTEGTLPSHIGVLTTYPVPDCSERSIGEYVDARWQWASMDNRHPVVIEEFLDVSASFAIEFFVADSGTMLLGTSTLEYEDNRICREVFGELPVPDRLAAEFHCGGAALADKYRAVGYRGHVCFDAIGTAAGELVFTEANARTATGTHVNLAFRELLTGATRTRLVQLASDRSWGALSTSAFLRAIGSGGLEFDPTTGHGVVMITPPLSDRPDGGFMYLIGSRDIADTEAYRDRVLSCVPRIEQSTAGAVS